MQRCRSQKKVYKDFFIDAANSIIPGNRAGCSPSHSIYSRVAGGLWPGGTGQVPCSWWGSAASCALKDYRRIFLLFSSSDSVSISSSSSIFSSTSSARSSSLEGSYIRSTDFTVEGCTPHYFFLFCCFLFFVRHSPKNISTYVENFPT